MSISNWSVEDISYLQTSLESGRTASRIAADLGSSLKAVTTQMRKLGIPTKSERVKAEVFRLIDEVGAKVIGEYRNAKTPLAIECAEGHREFPHPGSILAGSGVCRACSGCSPALAADRFRSSVEKQEGRVVGSYGGAHRTVEVICVKGHVVFITPQAIRKGIRLCSVCPTYSEPAETAFRERVALLGGEVVGEYVRVSSSILLTCAQGHECSPTPKNVLSGKGLCFHCVQTQQNSQGEQDLASWVRSVYSGPVETNVRGLIGRKEFDIYLPDLGMAIEYNGSYWHSFPVKPLKHMQEKSLLAEEQGIFVYHVFEYEWQNSERRATVQRHLSHLLTSSPSLYARKGEVRNVSSQEAQEFLKQNHRQGACPSSVRLGIYFENELKSLMTFGKPRFNKEAEWELLRYSSSGRVQGGASRLLSHFREDNEGNILSYSDAARTRGTMYSLLGFELLALSEPSYVWVCRDEVLSRYKTQKRKLLDQGFEGESETSIMQDRGFLKIPDAGQRVFLLT